MRFYAEVQGNRGPATRQGNAESGLWAHVRGRDIGIEVKCEAREDEDIIYVDVTGGSNGAFTRFPIARVHKSADGTVRVVTVDGDEESVSTVRTV